MYGIKEGRGQKEVGGKIGQGAGGGIGGKRGQGAGGGRGQKEAGERRKGRRRSWLDKA